MSRGIVRAALVLVAAHWFVVFSLLGVAGLFIAPPVGAFALIVAVLPAAGLAFWWPG